MRILFVCSSGGHLAQLYQLRPWWDRHERTWVTFDHPHAESLLQGERLITAFAPTTRNIPNALRNLRLAIKTIRAERPDVVISDGAGVAFPFFVVARLLRVRTRLPGGLRPHHAAHADRQAVLPARRRCSCCSGLSRRPATRAAR